MSPEESFRRATAMLRKPEQRTAEMILLAVMSYVAGDQAGLTRNQILNLNRYTLTFLETQRRERGFLT